MSERAARPFVQAIIQGERVDWTKARARRDLTAAEVASLETLDDLLRARAAATVPGGSIATTNETAFLRLIAFAGCVQALIGLAGWLLGAGRGYPVPAGPAAASLVVFMATAVWLRVGGRSDARALALSGFFFLIACAFGRRFLDVLARWPVWYGLFVKGIYPDTFLPVFLWRFVQRFPEVLRLSRADVWCARALRVAIAVSSALFLTNILAVHGVAPLWLQPLQRSDLSGAYWAVLFAIMLPAFPLFLVRARRAGLDDRRRLAVFALGIAVSVVPAILEIVAELLLPAFRAAMWSPAARRATAPFFFGLLLIAPVVTAYSILVDRVLDVRVTLGRTARYLLARNSIAVLTFAPGAALVLFALAHRTLTIEQLLGSGRGPAVAITTSLGVLGSRFRGSALRLVDRWIHRGPAEISEALPQVAARLSTARSVHEVAEVLEAACRALLDVEGTHLLLEDRASFLPVRTVAPPLPAECGIVTLAAADARPLPLGPDEFNSYFDLLPALERRWIVDTGSALAVALEGPRPGRRGMLIARSKRSGARFDRSELLVLSALASTAGLAVSGVADTAGADQPSIEPAAECPACGAVGREHGGTCACGSARRTASVPIVLNGKFGVQRLIGSGSMGIAYLARDLRLARPVVLKTLTRISAMAAERLEHEARIMAVVVHPNLATIFGLEHWNGTPILILEWVAGGTMSTGTQVEVPRALRMGILLARALEQLHAAGILHRDIKPSNIGFTDGGAPKLLDFGLASLLESAGVGVAGEFARDGSATQTLSIGHRIVAGTPLYLSPEAASGHPSGASCDLWSLSLVLYECLAGRNPFAAPTVAEVLRKIRRTEVPDLRRFRADCPAPVADTFAVLLSADPAVRPTTATALGEMLERLERFSPRVQT